VFNLEAEGDGEIVEVRLYYRIAGSRAWAYAYPTFTPQRHISASIDLRTAGVGYLPPGTMLEYYYVIRDALGNVHETSRTTIEYSDDRFRWQQAQIGPLTLLYHDLPQARIDALVPELESELQHVADLLQLELELEQPIKGLIYNQRSEALDAFPYQSRTITEEQIFGGFAFPERGVFVGLGLQPGVIIHESAHLLLRQALGRAVTLIPAWLDEGFATYAEPSLTPPASPKLRSQGLPLRAMSTVPGNPRDIYIFYQKSESVVGYLIEKYGAESFQQFLGQLRQGSDFSAALVRSYGFDTDGLEQRWAGVSGDTPAPDSSANPSVAPVPDPPANPSAAPSPFLYLDTFVIAGLTLLVMAILLGRYVVKKLRPSARPEEGLQPWEDPDRQGP